MTGFAVSNLLMTPVTIDCYLRTHCTRTFSSHRPSHERVTLFGEKEVGFGQLLGADEGVLEAQEWLGD